MPDPLTPAEREAIRAYRGPVRQCRAGETSEDAHGARAEYRTAAKRRLAKRRAMAAKARKLAKCLETQPEIAEKWTARNGVGSSESGLAQTVTGEPDHA